MVLKKASALGGTIIAVVLVVVFVPPVLLNETAEFREIFMKKCKGYPMDQTTCKNALNAFEKAFVGKNEKDVTEEDYEGLFKEVPFKHPCGITMFWTGTNELVHEFTKTRDHFFTLEDTLLGHVLNELKWCGKKNSQGIFIKECSEDKPNPVFSFWKLASAKMAQYACKIVTVMLDGEREKPYYDKR
ncbi:ADP-ribosyl cyclase/cyclic ADP-ribose hydrolase 1-like [Halichoeres trimaculatus]|uniref:ADP-ribosyl cyclase/cyclic ADP-ribose hydrolase 1-like n=1 Tax=Halichoeres trimaculatus TaxID=147232 RepID=UPI003D9E018A